MKNIMLAIKLMFSFFVLITLILLFIRLGVAIIFFIKNNNFYFEWVANIIDSLKKGAVTGSVLGFGIWFLSKMKENKNKFPPSEQK